MEKASRIITASARSLAALALSCLLGACSRGNAEWHPDTDGSGAWYDSSHDRVAGMKRSESENDKFEFERFSLDPRENRISYLSFLSEGQDAFVCADDSSLKLKISGPVLGFSGAYDDGSEFSETYKAVDKAFLKKKSGDAESRRKALAAKKDPSMLEQQELWTLEMIVQTLNEMKLPE